MNRTSKVPCETHVLFIWRLETQTCSLVSFFWTPPLCQKKIMRFGPTLGSNNSDLKNDSIKTITFSEISGRHFSYYGIPWIPLIFFGLELLAQMRNNNKQNFYDSPGQIPKLILTLRLKQDSFQFLQKQQTALFLHENICVLEWRVQRFSIFAPQCTSST